MSLSTIVHAVRCTLFNKLVRYCVASINAQTILLVLQSMRCHDMLHWNMGDMAYGCFLDADNAWQLQ